MIALESAAGTRIHALRRMACDLAARIESGCNSPALDEVLGLAAAVAEHPAAFNAVWHPLGCLYIELSRDTVHSVRLHVWRPASPGREIVHSHDFDMCSYVVAGTLVNSMYDVMPGAGTVPLLDIEYAQHGEILRPASQQVSCNRSTRQDLVAGQEYRVPAGHFHNVRALGGVAAMTFVSTRRVPGTAGQVLAYRGMKGSLVTRPACRPEETRSALLALLNRGS